MATGDFTIIDPLGKPRISVDAGFEQFRLNGDSIGIVKANGNIDLHSGLVNVKLVSPNENYKFNADVQLNLNDTTINTTFHFNHERIDLLKSYLISIFDDIDGYATGDLTVKGKMSERN